MPKDIWALLCLPLRRFILHSRRLSARDCATPQFRGTFIQGPFVISLLASALQSTSKQETAIFFSHPKAKMPVREKMASTTLCRHSIVMQDDRSNMRVTTTLIAAGHSFPSKKD